MRPADGALKETLPPDQTVTSGEPLAALLARLETTPEGLSDAEAARRLTRYGPNSPPAQRHSSAAELLRLVASPLVVILLIASGVSALLGELLNATIIIVIVLLSTILDFSQTYRSQRAVVALLRAVAPTATARREGRWQELARAELVPGDVIRLAAGDLVPADARLLTARDLHIQEAALTGESMPVEKSASDVDAPAAASVFLGSSVVSGSATAVVTATGRGTIYGDIAQRLSERPPETEFERGAREFSRLIARTVFVLVVLVFAINLGLRHGAVETLLFAVALAVGLTPEFLPMITAVTLTQGAVRMARRHVIVKHLASIEMFGSMDVLCSDKTGTLTTAEIEVEQVYDPFGAPASAALDLARINSAFNTGIRSPLDDAIVRQAGPPDASWRKLDELPFDFERRRLSVVAESGDRRLLIVKGAPESVLGVCASVAVEDQRLTLDEPTRERCAATYQRLSADGFRVLAVATREVDAQPSWTTADEHDLALIGFLVFLDPPLPDAAATLAGLRADGVQVKILTGDNDLVARHVCAAVGLDVSRVLLGDEIERLSPAELAQAAEDVAVFARVSPAQKHRIILALKERGHVVGYIGDGVNDAPSLHAADVGISVSNAVDIAKDAADIILLEHSLAALHEGILAGRQAFGNVMKYVLMGVSSNFGNMLSMAAASAILPYLPMLPSQILLNNFMYDLSQVTIPTDHVDASFSRRPRRWDLKIIRRFMLLVGPISSVYDFLTFFVLLRVLGVSERGFHTGWFIESLTTQTLVLFVIRTAGNPFRSRPSLPLVVSVLLIVAAGIGLPYTPVSSPLGFERLPTGYFAFLIVATSTYLLAVEFVKRRVLRWD